MAKRGLGKEGTTPDVLQIGPPAEIIGPDVVHESLDDQVHISVAEVTIDRSNIIWMYTARGAYCLGRLLFSGVTNRWLFEEKSDHGTTMKVIAGGDDLVDGNAITFGRDPGKGGVQLSGAGIISRKHFQLTVAEALESGPDRIRIVDLDSTHGTSIVIRGGEIGAEMGTVGEPSPEELGAALLEFRKTLANDKAAPDAETGPVPGGEHQTLDEDEFEVL